MARPRSFDTDEVLYKAMIRFWEAGYSGTTLDDLENVTGLKRVSLYNAFGDKRDLFVEALRCYSREVVAQRLKPLLEPSAGLRGIRRFFAGGLADKEGWPGGCLMVNTSIDEAPQDSEIFGLVDRHFRQMEEFFSRALQQARSSGALRSEIEVGQAAAYLLAFGQGIAVLGRNAETRDRVPAAVAMLIRHLESWEKRA